MHTATNSNNFLAYFNHIDKFFEMVLSLEAYMPYSEKVEKIALGNYPVSVFVKKHQQKLKYFGDLRNQIVHGFRLEQHHYLLASDYAISQIQRVHELLTNPPVVGQQFLRAPVCAQIDESMLEVRNRMRAGQRYVTPVYDAKKAYVNFISEHKLLVTLTSGKVLDEKLLVRDCLEAESQETVLFMDTQTSVFEIEGLFSQAREDEKSLVAVFLTAQGNPDSPIEGIITPADLPKLDEACIL